MRTYILLFFANICILSHSFGQVSKTYYELDVDFNHYSIEKLESHEGFIIAGTLFKNGNNNMHIFLTDSDGDTIWQREIDLSEDDRVLDVVEGADETIAVTGYTIVNGLPEMYVSIFDLGGNQINAVTTPFVEPSYGTKIIYSYYEDCYIVGGLYEGNYPAGVPITNSQAVVVSFDQSLNVNWSKELRGYDNRHSSINDILELEEGYFLTGSVSFLDTSVSSRQGVLAYFIYPDGSSANNLSFQSTNSEHYGVSAVLDTESESIWLMSNNSIIHTPQITEIDISLGIGSSSIVQNYYLELDKDYGAPDDTLENAAGFKLLQPMDPNKLLAVGRYRKHDIDGDIENSPVWFAEFYKDVDEGQIGITDFYTYDILSPGYYQHGGSLFSSFQGEHPYIFTQDLAAGFYQNHITQVYEFAFLAPRIFNDRYSLDLVKMDYQFSTAEAYANCFTPYEANVDEIQYRNIAANSRDVDVSPNYVLSSQSSSVIDISLDCDTYDGDGSGKKLQSEIETDQSDHFKIYPNPFSKYIKLEYPNTLQGKKIEIYNSSGYAVHSMVLDSSSETTKVDLRNMARGLYFIKLPIEGGGYKYIKLIKR